MSWSVLIKSRRHLNLYKKFAECNLLIQAKGLTKYGTFNGYGIDAIFKLGYAATTRVLEKKNPLVRKSKGSCPSSVFKAL